MEASEPTPSGARVSARALPLGGAQPPHATLVPARRGSIRMVRTVRGRGWESQAVLVAAFLEETLVGRLLGVFVHGSAALGGWMEASDLDIVVTCDAVEEDWLAVGRSLLSALAPAPSVELSVVSAAAAAVPGPPWPYLLHLNQADSRPVIDDGTGDPDLLMHYLVTRSHGITIRGTSPAAAFGPVPHETALPYLRDELAWSLDGADQRYAVLNACRALAFAVKGSLLPKVAGGAWALTRSRVLSGRGGADSPAAGHRLGPATPQARAFVHHCIDRIEAAAAATSASR